MPLKQIYHMAQSLSKIFLHLIFHIKSTSPLILDGHLDRIHSYIGQLINETGCKSIRIGGVGDHVHIVFLLSKDERLSHLVEEVKRHSSRWIKQIDDMYKDFLWQAGYAAFSVSRSMVNKTIAYVEHQQEHHKRLSFRDEYIAFLKLYDIDYDERYVFAD